MRNLRVLLLLFGFGLAFGQTQKPPSCDAPEFHQFDFWAGRWEVRQGDQLVGYSQIDQQLRGCLIVENWFGTDGDIGKSMNFYRPGAKQWRQVYVGVGWNLDYLGQAENGGMVFHATRARPDGTEVKLRLTFTPMPDGSVRQHKEQSRDGETWKDVYDFRYTKTKGPIPASLPKGPGCESPEQKQFGFWVGSWDVYGGPAEVGFSHVKSVANGCIVFENWLGAQGGPGKSFNFYDPAKREWRQVWVAPGGFLDLHGAWKDGAIRFSGQTPTGNGTHADERLTFTPQADGSVRQFWERSTDGGQSWTVAFDGRYVRSDAAK